MSCRSAGWPDSTHEVRMVTVNKGGGRSTGPKRQGRERERELSPLIGRYSMGTFYKMVLFNRER